MAGVFSLRLWSLLTCSRADVNYQLGVLDGGVEEKAVGELHHHGVLHVLAVLLRVVVGDGVAAILEVLVSPAVLEGVGVDARRRTRRSRGARLVALGQVELILVAGLLGRLDSVLPLDLGRRGLAGRRTVPRRLRQRRVVGAQNKRQQRRRQRRRQQRRLRRKPKHEHNRKRQQQRRRQRQQQQK